MQFLNWLETVEKAPEATCSFYSQKCGQLVRVMNQDRLLVDVDATAVDGFIETRSTEGASRSTIGKELTALRRVLKLMKRRGCYPLGLDSVMPVKWSNEYEPRTRALSLEELERLCAELAPYRAKAVRYIVATGARLGELFRAQPSDVSETKVRLRGTKTKKADAYVPIVKELRHLLSPPPFATWGNIRRDLSAACARAGIERCTPNDLRRTHATLLVTWGVATGNVARMMRHADSRMVELVYGRIGVDALGDLVTAQIQHGGLAPENTEDEIPSDVVVSRDRIELSTRGFSGRSTSHQKSESPENHAAEASSESTVNQGDKAQIQHSPSGDETGEEDAEPPGGRRRPLTLLAAPDPEAVRPGLAFCRARQLALVGDTEGALRLLREEAACS